MPVYAVIVVVTIVADVQKHCVYPAASRVVTAAAIAVDVVVCVDVDAKLVSENTQRAVPFTKCQKQSQSYCQHDLSQHKPYYLLFYFFSCCCYSWWCCCCYCCLHSLLAIAKTFSCVYPIQKQEKKPKQTIWGYNPSSRLRKFQFTTLTAPTITVYNIKT